MKDIFISLGVCSQSYPLGLRHPNSECKDAFFIEPNQAIIMDAAAEVAEAANVCVYAHDACDDNNGDDNTCGDETVMEDAVADLAV